MRRRAWGVVLAAWVVTSGVRAQQNTEQNFSAQRFRLSEDGTGLISVNSGAIPGHLDWDAGLVLDYANNPLVLRRGDERVGALIAHRVGSELTFAFGLFDYLALEFALPVVLFQARGDTPGLNSVGLQDLMPAGLSDVRIAPKLRLLREDLHFVSLSLTPTVTLPGALLQAAVADASPSYLGESGPTLVPELALSTRRLYGSILALNLAYRLRGAKTFQNLEVRDELLFRLGVGYDIAFLAKELPLTLMAELSGATSVSEPFTDYTTSPMEWLAGVRYEPIPGLALFAGGGSGIRAGFGTPDFRLLGGIRFGMYGHDSDGDGINDDQDRCPEQAEDKDEFEDSDGCPDLDNDADGLQDTADQCPDQAEDADGFEDQDGCPDPDNDKDGLKDAEDGCPDEAGSVELKGCPAPDTDGDGIIDTKDNCVDDPEDKDGFEDRDGCPDPDNDKDGLLDAADKCPDQAEDKDGFEDEDGCPDPDNDQDTVLDVDDKCPNEPAPADRAAMGNGCPLRDTDGDGVNDDVDPCPADAEDVDGFEDDDGCPDLDNDRDGVPDTVDKCPNEPETINGVKDEDGCPDQGKQVVILTKDKIEILEMVYFDSGKAKIQKRSFKLLDQVAQVLKGNTQIKKVRVEGHTDDRGKDSSNKKLSQARAESVTLYLIEAGVDPSRLASEGFGEERPVADNKTAKGREKNRRVEFNIIEQ